ncbi:MAG: ATP-binding protein [Pseudomonadota bacterium]
MAHSEPDISLQHVGPSALDRLMDVLIPFRRRNRELARENQRLEAFLRAVPVEYCGWDQEGARILSPGFCTLFSLDDVSSFQDIQSAVTAGDAAAMEGLFDRLRRCDEDFDINVNTVIGGKTLRLSGRRRAARDDRQDFSVICACDVTDFSRVTARSMEATTAAEKRENEFLGTLNALPFPVWLRNQKLDLVWCNKSYARIVDDTGASVIADQKELPMTGAAKGNLSQRVLSQRAVAKQAAQSSRGHIIADGQRRLVEMTEIPVASEKMIVGVALDVTREEEWESSYKRLADSHNEALEQLRTAIAIFDINTRLEFYNSAYEQLTGMPGSWMDSRPRLIEVIDKLLELRKLPEQADYKQFKQVWLNKFTSLLEPYEDMQYLSDGSVIRMIVVPRPMGGMLMTLEDVTSLLQLETSYNTLMAVQQETMDNLAEGIVVFGEDGRVRLSNKAFSGMWRFLPEELADSAHISNLVEKTKSLFDDVAWPEMRQTILGNGLEREPRRGRLRRKDGSVLEYSVMPLPDGNILNSYFDITDTVKVEQALLEKNAALEATERLKTDFLANVSYQLRTPLNAIMGFAEMLNQQYFGKLNDRQMEYTSGMIEAGQRLVSLVNDILDLSTIEAGYLKLYPSDVNVKTLIERVAGLTEEWARKQKLAIVVMAPDDALSVRADERRLKQVLLNLISNAINYSPNGGVVTLSAEREGDFLILGVRDTGMGIPAEDMARVFTPFEKIHSKKVQRRSGAGLGLTLVRSIVELHGGSVMIDSTEDIGTSVVCRLPLSP